VATKSIPAFLSPATIAAAHCLSFIIVMSCLTVKKTSKGREAHSMLPHGGRLRLRILHASLPTSNLIPLQLSQKRGLTPRELNPQVAVWVNSLGTAYCESA
jgi:hypothetical protein